MSRNREDSGRGRVQGSGEFQGAELQDKDLRPPSTALTCYVILEQPHPVSPLFLFSTTIEPILKMRTSAFFTIERE
jgi:hypothetical protein